MSPHKPPRCKHGYLVEEDDLAANCLRGEGLMSEGLRAAIDWWENSVYTELTEAEEDHVRELVAAARAWLASEQTPDYQAANDEWDRDVVRMFDAAHEYDNDDWLLKRLIRCVDAALVGFHPQPEGDD